MNNFEEQFPSVVKASLEKYAVVLIEVQDSIITENCLDKQKVREAISDFCKHYRLEPIEKDLILRLGL